MIEENEKCACHGSTLTRFIQPILLFCLAEQPNHGYDLLQRISETKLWKDTPPDATGVYRVLRDMEKRGLVTSYTDSESRAAKGKRVFQITQDGIDCMNNWISTLECYRQGIDQVITRLRRAAAAHPNRKTQNQSEASCCCGSVPAAEK